MLPGIILLLFVLAFMGWIILVMLPKIVDLNTKNQEEKQEQEEGFAETERASDDS